MQTQQLKTFGLIDPKANVLLTVQRAKQPQEIVKLFDQKMEGEAFVKDHTYRDVGEGALEMPGLTLFCVYDMDKSGLDSSALTEDEGGLSQVDDPAGTVRTHAKLVAVILREKNS